jgi:LysM repeat protein
MKETLLENAFAACLDDIEQKGTSLEDCLARFPDLRDELEPALRTVLDIQAVPAWEVSPEFKATARQRIVRRIRARESDPAASGGVGTFNPFAWVGRLVGGTPVLVRVMAVVLAGLLIITGGTAIATSDSPPDSPLHQLKLATENLELLLKPAGEGRTTMLVDMLDRRSADLLTMSWQQKADAAEHALVNYQAVLQVGHKTLQQYDPKNADDTAFAVQWQEALARNLAVIQGLVDSMPQSMQAVLKTAITNTQKEQTWVNDLLVKTPHAIETSPTRSPEGSPTPGSGTCSYTVKKGDTLSSIAQHNNTTWQRLAALNNLTSPDSIRPGQQLSVPCSSGGSDSQLTPPAEFKLCPYTVKGGDTLSTIAQRYNTTTRLLIAVNNLPSADRILSGQRLSVPCYVK